VKYHFISDQGIEFLTQAEGDRLAGTDPDLHTKDLYEAIERGDHPSWTLKMQIMPYEDAKTYRFNPFDITKVWPHADYPLIEVGKMTLDRNPVDYHTEIEQLASRPATWCRASGRARTGCCWAGCSPTTTRTGPGSA
jgi:catalase